MPARFLRTLVSSGILSNCNRLLNLRIISDNPELKGKIPKSIGYLSNLEKLELNNNGLTGRIPKSFGNLATIRSIELFNNDLEGWVYRSFDKLDELRKLYLNNNPKLNNVAISPILENKRGLSVLIDTTRPPVESQSDCEIVKAVLFDLGIRKIEEDCCNQRSRGIRVSCDGARVVEFQLVNVGAKAGIPFPPSIFKLDQLKVLRLVKVNLTGAIPKEIGQLVNLQSLYWFYLL